MVYKKRGINEQQKPTARLQYSNPIYGILKYSKYQDIHRYGQLTIMFSHMKCHTNSKKGFNKPIGGKEVHQDIWTGYVNLVNSCPNSEHKKCLCPKMLKNTSLHTSHLSYFASFHCKENSNKSPYSQVI